MSLDLDQGWGQEPPAAPYLWKWYNYRGQVIENAHPAIITLEEAEAIMEINKRQSQIAQDRSKGRMAKVRTKGSRYLLSGGLFVCKRCGANMVGYRTEQALLRVWFKGLQAGLGMW